MEYKNKTDSIDREVLSEVKARKTMIEVTNLSVKKFENMCSKKKTDYGKQSIIFKCSIFLLRNILDQ